MNRLLSLIKFFIGWPITIISLIFIVKIISGNYLTVLGSIKNINIVFLLTGILCFFAYFLLRSILWQKIIQQKGVSLTIKEAAYIFSISEIKRYAPGNIWSFLSRSYLLEKKGLSKKSIFHSILIEAELVVLSCLLLSYFAIHTLFTNLFLDISTILLFLVLSSLFIFGNKLKKIGKLLPDFSPVDNFYLLLISIPTFFFFGLATYFSMISIININLYYVAEYISIFILSLLIGYLSIITPMGLGVREGMITYGLSRFINNSLAATVAIFGRIVFIFSELIFLLFVFIFYKSRNKILVKIENFISLHKYTLILLIGILIYITYFTTASFLKYDNFYTGRFDLGNMDQAVWNTFHGRIFQITDPNGTSIISRLSFHADFILILIAPLYKIWASPETLLFLQSFVLGLGAIFVYLLSLEILKNKNLSLIFSLAFLLSPAVSYSNLYDFHPVTLATTFLLATTYFFIRKKYLLFIIFALLAALTKEEVWAIVSIYGLVLILSAFKDLLRNKSLSKQAFLLKTAFGVITFSLCFGIFYYLIWYAIPHSRGAEHFALSYYSDFGNSPTSVIKNIFLQPGKTILTIFSLSKIYYLFQIFVHLGFLSFFSPAFLIFAIPDLMINTLSSNSQLSQIYYQYTATITPFIFISAIYGVKKLSKSFPRIPLNYYAIFLACIVFYSAYTIGPLPGALRPSIQMFNNPIPEKDIINNYIKNIGARYSIAATNNLGSHLSRRQKIYTIPIGIGQADVILFLLNDKFAQPSLAAQIKMANNLKGNKNYVEIYKHGAFIVFEKKNLYLEKKPSAKQTNLFPWSITSLQNRDYVESQVTVEKKVSSSKTFSSFIISYLSDGLKLYSLMNIPTSKMPENGFPVVIINHGFIEPKDYSTIDSYKSITDYFSEKGYLVLKPDYRGNGNSETEDTALMRFAYPVDVLNLIESLKSIPQANSNQIYLYGHSMGGEITLKVLEIAGKDPPTLARIKAAVVWAPVTNLSDWFNKSHVPWLQETKNNKNYYADTFKVMGTPEENPLLWQSVSPINYLSDIQTPIQINHGISDGTVSYRTSIELYDNLISLNKTSELLMYPNNDHNLLQSWDKAAANSLSFFKKY
jgi:uncharacterized membrane protein/uncharacterized membrane protein YbhN (UPF0104 family)/dienelactone hydrolase